MRAQKKDSAGLVDHDKLAAYCRRNGIARLAVFGSFLTNTFRPDRNIDLLVTFAPEARVGFLALGRMQRELSELFGCPVDLVPEDGLKPAVRQIVLKRTVAIYAAQRDDGAGEDLAVHPADQEGFERLGSRRPLPYSRNHLAGLCRRWQVIELALFGSAQRRESRTEGEIDILVSFSSEADWSLFDRVALQDELSDLFGREAHLVERGEPHNPLNLREILTTLEVIYAPEGTHPPAGSTGPQGNG